MPKELRLTPTSYIVLGLLEVGGEATPYDLKLAAATVLGEFWSLQHAQLYREPARLAEAGYLTERREEGGRRRKHYKITERGREALQGWLSDPSSQVTDLRDLGLLKIFFGADPGPIAEARLQEHRQKLAEYEGFRAGRSIIGGEGPVGPQLVLDAGIGFLREGIRFWSRLAKEYGGGEEEE